MTSQSAKFYARPKLCSVHSQEIGESLEGWGKHGTEMALIQWPKGKWQHSLRIAKDMPEALEREIESMVSSGRRVNLIDRKSYTSDLCRVFLFPEAVFFECARKSLPAVLEKVRSETGADFIATMTKISKPLILCCTHGKHDRCCAKFGFATYAAIRDHAAAKFTSQFDIWETTHLGGCRFASTVLVVPQMHKYGRLAICDVPDFLESEARDDIYLPRFRGACDLSPDAQVAEIAARRYLQLPSASMKVEIVKEKDEGETVLYGVRISNKLVAVRCTRHRYRSFGTCDDIDHAEETAEKISWQAVLCGWS